MKKKGKEKEREDDEALLEKMIKLKIFERPSKAENYKMHFTKRFNQSFSKTVRRLDADPATDSLDISEGLRAVLLNYILSSSNNNNNDIQVNEYELYNMSLMVYTLSMLNANKDPLDIPY